MVVCGDKVVVAAAHNATTKDDVLAAVDVVAVDGVVVCGWGCGYGCCLGAAVLHESMYKSVVLFSVDDCDTKGK